MMACLGRESPPVNRKALEEVSRAILELARSLSALELAEKAYFLVREFQAGNSPRQKGVGASGKLDLDLIRKMASASR